MTEPAPLPVLTQHLPLEEHVQPRMRTQLTPPTSVYQGHDVQYDHPALPLPIRHAAAPIVPSLIEYQPTYTQSTMSAPHNLHSGPIATMNTPPTVVPSRQLWRPPDRSIHQQALHAIPQPKIPDFVNDNEREFANLKLALDNLLEPHMELDEKYKYHILLEHLKLPEAQMIGQSFRHHPYPYSAAIHALQVQYGQSLWHRVK